LRRENKRDGREKERKKEKKSWRHFKVIMISSLITSKRS
jgi:hypothetical protein